jgi:hypothetical protein
VLLELTESDLEKLGVLLGHRKRMLRAIDKLRTTALPALAGQESIYRLTNSKIVCDYSKKTVIGSFSSMGRPRHSRPSR